MELKLSNDEVAKIVENHLRHVLAHFADGKDVTVCSHSYAGLAAKVSITEKEKDDGQ